MINKYVPLYSYGAVLKSGHFTKQAKPRSLHMHRSVRTVDPRSHFAQ